MPERIAPSEYFKRSSLEDTPYIIPLPMWILFGIAIVGLICVAIYAIHKT